MGMVDGGPPVAGRGPLERARRVREERERGGEEGESVEDFLRRYGK